MQDMAHSICLIKLYQITMRKNFDFLFLTALIVVYILKCFGMIHQLRQQSEIIREGARVANNAGRVIIFCPLKKGGLQFF